MWRMPRNVRAVVFDVYGTLLEVASPLRPFRKLLELAEQRGCPVEGAVASQLFMTRSLDLSKSIAELQLPITSSELAQLESLLAEELASIRPFPDAIPTLARLRKKGLKLAVCSNLAVPYVQPARSLLEPCIDASIWSCDVGCLKPAREIFMIALDRLEALPESTLMVGDSHKADIAGARAAGMTAVLLERNSRRQDPNSIDSLLTLAR